MRIVGINGIATDGEDSTDLLLAKLRERGFETVDVKLPVRHTFGARWYAAQDAIEIMRASEPGDVLVCHSFGCLRAAYALRAHALEYLRAYLFRPAMSQDWKFDNPARITCIYSHDDRAIRVGGWLPMHPFGHAGLKGFKQQGVTNVERHGGHSKDFCEPALTYWANRISGELMDMS